MFGILLLIILGISGIVIIAAFTFLCCFCRRETENQDFESLTEQELNDPLVNVSPVVISDSVIYHNQNQKHTPLLQPAPSPPKNGPLIVDAKGPPLPGGIPFTSAEFPSVTLMANPVDFPSVAPVVNDVPANN